MSRKSKTDGLTRHGSVFDVKKTEYSKETHMLLKELLRESKLSLLNKRKVKESIRNGESLPVLQRPSSAEVQISNKDDVLVKPKTFRRRSQEIILKSGAYELGVFVPPNHKFNSEVEKEKLQSMMAYGKIVSQEQIDTRKRRSKPRKNQDPLADETDDETFLKLLDGITERLEFLQEMELYGKGKEYKAIVGQEIATRFRLMKQLDPDRCAKLDKYQILKNLTNSSPSTTFTNEILLKN